MSFLCWLLLKSIVIYTIEEYTRITIVLKDCHAVVLIFESTQMPDISSPITLLSADKISSVIAAQQEFEKA